MRQITVITRKSLLQTSDLNGDHNTIGAGGSLACRQQQNRPINEDYIRGLRRGAERLGSGEWVIA